jgi:thioredoxin
MNSAIGVSACHAIENMNANDDKPLVLEVSAANFMSEVLTSKQPVLAVFWAPWSRPCCILNSMLQEVATACGENAKVVKVNADENIDLSMWYEIQSIPTLLCFIRGIVRAKFVGTASKEAILDKLQEAIHNNNSLIPASSLGK